MIHIHSPDPIRIKDGIDYEIDPNAQPDQDRFGRLLIYTNGCCRKHRLARNCNVQFYKWYEPLVVCKDGKGCKRKEKVK